MRLTFPLFFILGICFSCLLNGQSKTVGRSNGAQPQVPAKDSQDVPIPTVVHFCALHCGTLVWDKTHFTGPSDPGGSVWFIESFTRNSVIIHRTDYRPRPYTAVYRATISPDGNTIDGNGFKFAWGTALNSIPGTGDPNPAMFSRNLSQPPEAPAQRISPGPVVNATPATPTNDASSVRPSGPPPVFKTDAVFTYDLTGDWKLAFPAESKRHPLVLVDIRQKGEDIQMIVDTPNIWYPFQATMFQGKYANNLIKGDWMDGPAHLNERKQYDSTRIDINIENPSSMVTSAGIRLTRSIELGANKLCDAVKYAAMPAANIFIYGSRDLELKNYGNAACWMYIAASQGHHEAQLDLSVFFHLGLGLAVDDKQSFLWLKTSASQGNKRAQSYLAHYYKTGIGVAKNAALAEAWSVRAKDGAPEPDLPETPEQAVMGLIHTVSECHLRISWSWA